MNPSSVRARQAAASLQALGLCQRGFIFVPKPCRMDQVARAMRVQDSNQSTAL
jgi:hypothetical protein